MSKIIEEVITLAGYDPRNDNKSKREKARAFLRFRRSIRREIINGFLIVVGVLAATFGLKSFLLPNHFIDGGITGVSLLVRAVTGWQLPWLIIALNIPFIFLGL